MIFQLNNHNKFTVHFHSVIKVDIYSRILNYFTSVSDDIRMWSTRLLAFALLISSSTFPANSQDVDYLGIPCMEENHCNIAITYLRCFPKSNSRNSGKMCECRRNEFYDRTQKKCLIGEGSACKAPTYDNKNPQGCISTAECVFQIYNGKKAESGTCTLKSDLTAPAQETKEIYKERVTTRERMEEESEERETSTSTPRPPTFLTVNGNGDSHSVSMATSPLGQSCITDESCEHSRTFLRCLSNKSGTQCGCGRNGGFDKEKQVCLLFIGSRCNLPTDENRNPQQCVKHGKCIPDKDSRGSALTIGTCCDSVNQQSCSKYAEITTGVPPHSTTMKILSSVNPLPQSQTQIQSQSQVQEQSPSAGHLQGKKCQNPEDCNSKQTYLQCLSSAKKSENVCQCRRNHVYDQGQKKCLIGIESECKAPTYYDPNPQACIPIAECVRPDLPNGKKSESGTCTCKSDSTEPPCDKKKTAEFKDLGRYHKPCQHHSDCLYSTTFLKCINSSNTKKICDCGKIHQYHTKLKKCFLGLGSSCTISENNSSPKCGPNLMCASSRGGNTNNINRNRNDPNNNVGTCVCRHGERGSSGCDTHGPKTDPLVTQGSVKLCSYFPVPVTLLISYFISYLIS